MSVAAAQLSWIAGLVLLFAPWGRQVARARRGAPPPSRGEIAALAALVVGLGLGAAAAWGGLVASDGLRRISDAPPAERPPLTGGQGVARGSDTQTAQTAAPA